MKDLANVISSKIEIIGLRPGEELHENLISKRELKFTRVDNDYIFILNKKNPDKLIQPGRQKFRQTLQYQKLW